MKIIIKKINKTLNGRKNVPCFIENRNNLISEGGGVKRSAQKFIIDTKHGNKEVTASLVSEHWYAYKSGGKFFVLTHKASGRKIPFTYYDNITKYKTEKKDNKGRLHFVTSVQNMKDLISDLENSLSFPDLGSPNPSESTITSIGEFFKSQNATENTLNELTSQETAEGFGDLADTFGDISTSMAGDAEKSEKMQQFIDGLDIEGLDQINNLDQLLANLGDGENLSKLTQSLKNAGIKEEEVGEYILQLRQDFDEYRETQEKNQKNAARKETEEEIADQGENAEI
jgi:hypothetical protein